MIEKNYHTHTYRCKHAQGDCREYVTEALKAGCTTLGFSEHMPLPNDRWTHVHLEAHELQEYIDTVHRCRDENPDLEVLLGGECEYVKADHAYYEEVLLGEHRFDYLLGAPHWIPCGSDWVGYTHLERPKDLRYFADYCIDVIQSGLFSYIAHPDVFMVGYRTWDGSAAACARDIIEAAMACGVPLELNAYGLRKAEVFTFDEFHTAWYPYIGFWELASQLQAPMIIGSDAHAPEQLCDRVELCEEIVQRYGLDLHQELPYVKGKLPAGAC
ncbi:MAG: histidinol-phosphatase [Spirochaetia bacterium]|nr:histidinol-phosphatase [Spirochaetia bacterium]